MNTPERARVPAEPGGARSTEVRYVRMWMWPGPDGTAHGVRLWNTDPNLRGVRFVVEVRGPVGSASYSRAGAEMPVAAIVSALQLAGIPPFVSIPEPDLTRRQRVDYARGSATPPTEGEHVEQHENVNAADVETAEPFAQPAPVVNDDVNDADADAEAFDEDNSAAVEGDQPTR